MTKPTIEFVSIVYLSLLVATIVATVITKSALVLIGGLVGTSVVVRILVKGIF
jgi:hypothetical protein